MGNTTTALVFVMILNVLMFLGQVAILDMNPTGTVYYNSNGSLLTSFDKGDNILDSDSAIGSLPEADGSISPTTGNLFTDTFSSIKNWFTKTTGLNYLYGIISAPYNLLKAMHLPTAFCFALGTLWYAVTLFLIVSFFWGKGD